jgi:hypothetical protein
MKPMRGSSSRVTVVAITGVAVTAVATILAAFSLSNPDDKPGACEPQSVDKPGRGCEKALVRLFEQGKGIFRFDTFGDEDYWGGMLQLHRAIEGAALGGVGPGVSPKTALTVAGLKVDVDALPGNVQAQLKQGKVDLDNPASTLALLQLNAVVGVKGVFGTGGSLNSIGITCALCHSTVDNSFAAGIGKRLDGWPNQDLNVGLIVSLAPNLAPMAAQVLGASDPAAIATLKKVLLSWAPASTTPRSTSTPSASDPTASRPRSGSRPPTAILARTSTRGRAASATSRTGTPTSRTFRCTATATSTTSGSTIRANIRPRSEAAFSSCVTTPTR